MNAGVDNLRKNFYQTGTIVFLGIIFWGIFQISKQVSEIITAIGFSILIAYLLIGIVDWLEGRTKLPRLAVILLLYLLLGIIFSIFAIVILPSVIEQTTLLAQLIPGYVDSFVAFLGGLQEHPVFAPLLKDLTFNLSDLAAQISSVLSGLGRNVAPKVLSFAFQTISFAFFTITTIVLSVYFLWDGPNLWNLIMRPLNDEYQKHAESLKYNLSRCLRGYLAGQIQLSSLSGLFMFITYLILGSKYALILALWQAAIEIIPVIGNYLGIGVGVLVIGFSMGWIKALIAFGLYMLYTQIVKENLLTPRIMGNAINLHPAFVLIVMITGAKLAGLIGVIFALPIAGIFNVLVNYYIDNRYEN